MHWTTKTLVILASAVCVSLLSDAGSRGVSTNVAHADVPQGLDSPANDDLQTWKFLASLPLVSIGVPNKTEAQRYVLDEKSPRKVVVVWASWCGYCKSLLASMSTKAPKQGLTIIALSADESIEEALSAAKSFVANRGPKHAPIEFAFDTSGRLRKWVSQGSIPLSLVFDRSGLLTASFRGNNDRKRRALFTLMDKTP